jgi:hypothetical protein
MFSAIIRLKDLLTSATAEMEEDRSPIQVHTSTDLVTSNVVIERIGVGYSIVSSYRTMDSKQVWLLAELATRWMRYKHVYQQVCAGRPIFDNVAKIPQQLFYRHVEYDDKACLEDLHYVGYGATCAIRRMAEDDYKIGLLQRNETIDDDYVCVLLSDVYIISCMAYGHNTGWITRSLKAVKAWTKYKDLFGRCRVPTDSYRSVEVAFRAMPSIPAKHVFRKGPL